MKTLYHGNRNKTTEMVQEEVFDLGLRIKILSPYTKGLDPLECHCLVCGHEWTGTASRLLTGVGCNNCARRINQTLENLQSQLNSLGKNFTVSGDFIKSTDKLNVVCDICSYTWQSTSSVLRRASTLCKMCRAGGQRTEKEKVRSEKTKQEFYRKFKEKDKKLTLNSEFVDYDTLLEVSCNTCGYICIKDPTSILTNNCASCSRKLKGSVEKLQIQLNNDNRKIQVSGVYTNAFGKLDCLCEVCGGEWTTNPHNLNRTGCPTCARTGFDPNKPGYLYYLRVSDENCTYWKIGITNLGVKERFRPADRKKIKVLYCHLFENGTDAQTAERNVLKMFKTYKAIGVKTLQTGNTELFVKDVLQMDHLNWGDI